MEGVPQSVGAAGVAIVLGKPVVDAAVNLAMRMLGKPCDLIGEAAADQVKAWRWTNQVRIFSRAAEKLQAMDSEGIPVPPSFLVPLIEASALVDDDTLQDLFAELIARANSDGGVRQPLILETLKRLSPEDATTLTAIRDTAEENSENYSQTGEMDEPALESIARLVALGLIELRIKPEESFGEEGEMLSGADDLRGPVITDPSDEAAVITRFGRQFLQAVGLAIAVADPDWYDDVDSARFA